MRYIKSFQNDAAIQAAVDNKTLGKPYVALDDQLHRIDWNGKGISPETIPLTFNILTNGAIKYGTNSQYLMKVIEYKKNDNDWVEITATTAGTLISVESGDTIQFRGNNESYGVSNDNLMCGFSGSTAQFSLSGNIMSLVSKNGYDSIRSVGDYAFKNMFRKCTTLVDVSKLVLPATTLGKYCYSYMFHSCTSLTSAPALPATNLNLDSYENMFYGCTRLTSAPVLHATTLSQSSYTFMFCNCSSLNYVKCLATNNLNGNTYLWLSGVSPTGTFVKKAGVTWPTGASGIPSGWTVIEE